MLLRRRIFWSCVLLTRCVHGPAFPSTARHTQITASPHAVQHTHTSLFGRDHCLRLQTADGLVYFGARNEAEQIRWTTAFRSCRGCSHRPDATRISRSIEIGVMEAKGLPVKPADYVCTVLVDGEPLGRTRTAGNTDTPFWGEALHFDHLPATDCTLTVRVSRVASGLLRFAREASTGKARNPHAHVDVVAWVDLPCGDTLHPQEKAAQHEKWVALAGHEGASIRMRVQCMDSHLLPHAAYDSLSAYFDFEDTGDTGEASTAVDDVLVALQASIKSGERLQLCQTLLRCSSSLAYLLAVCRMEIRNTADENVLFRGNSLASVSVDQFMKILAMNRSSYLKNTLATASFCLLPPPPPRGLANFGAGLTCRVPALLS